MTKIMFLLSNKLVKRIKAVISVRERSRALASLLEKEIRVREQNLYACAKELEASKGLKNEMAIWDNEFSKDGLR